MNIRSDIKVELIGQWGTDQDIAEAAWASSGNSSNNPDKMKGLIRSLFRDRHGSPFDEGFLSVYIEAPRAVRDEWVRHRNLSYSSSSLRYTMAKSEVYLPGRNRPILKDEGFKQIRPIYKPMTDEQYDFYWQAMKDAYEFSDEAQQNMIDEGIDTTEALRWITTDGHYVHFRARGMLRPWLQFLQLRTHEEKANHKSFPMYEIEVAARQVEDIIKEHWPVTYAAWEEFGRDI